MKENKTTEEDKRKRTVEENKSEKYMDVFNCPVCKSMLRIKIRKVTEQEKTIFKNSSKF